MDHGVPVAAWRARGGCRLVGVGLGPGDPDLLTVKAVQAIRAADVVLVPRTERSEQDSGRAEDVIREACPDVAPRIRRVSFAMREVATTGEPAGGRPPSEPHTPAAHTAEEHAVEPAEPVTRAAARDAAAAQALACYDAGAQVIVLATIGDPSVYSTFSYVASRVRRGRPDVRIEVVPGITAMQAVAAAAALPLVEGQETLTLVPATAAIDTLETALSGTGTVVVYKGGRLMPQVRSAIERHGRVDGAVLGTDLGTPAQRVRTLSETDPLGGAPYFSTVFCPARGRTGGGDATGSDGRKPHEPATGHETDRAPGQSPNRSPKRSPEGMAR